MRSRRAAHRRRRAGTTPLVLARLAIVALLAAACATRDDVRTVAASTTVPTTTPTTAVPSTATPTTTVPASPTTTVPLVPTTTRGGLTAGGPVFKHCTITDDGCTVDDPGPGDVIAGAPDPMPRPTHDGLAYGPRPEQVLDVYLPEGGAAEIVVYFHAGGWTTGDRRAVPYAILHELTRHRAVISVDYRLAPAAPWPAPLQDAARAIRWIRRHAGEWGLAARPIVAAGGSAGGHLALFLAAAPGHLPDPTLPDDLRAIDPRVAGVVALAAPADVGSMLEHDWGPPLLQALLGCSTDCSPQVLADASPSTHLTRDAPPAYLAVGALDTLVPPKVNLFALAASWRAATGPRGVWVDLVDGQQHNIDVQGVNVTALDEFLSMAMDR